MKRDEFISALRLAKRTYGIHGIQKKRSAMAIKRICHLAVEAFLDTYRGSASAQGLADMAAMFEADLRFRIDSKTLTCNEIDCEIEGRIRERRIRLRNKGDYSGFVDLKYIAAFQPNKYLSDQFMDEIVQVIEQEESKDERECSAGNLDVTGGGDSVRYDDKALQGVDRQGRHPTDTSSARHNCVSFAIGSQVAFKTS